MKRFLLVAVLGTMCWLLPAQFRYRNPVLHADYSDPDVCRVGEDYWMTASSFNFFPGLPILHSRDLVHWELVGTALTDYPGEGWNGPEDDFRTVVRHGDGVWAPAIRYHDGWYYLFVGDPDRGIFRVRTQDPTGPWEPPVWVVREKGFIDPCPFWDEDGNAYLSHACAGSRAGLKSVLFVAPMDPDGSRLLGPSRIVYDGHASQPTIEGTKFYKRDGNYYLFAPAGGVATGWQTVLRADNPFGPYEERIVLAWAEGTVNGPHQGAWVDTPEGEDWFLHFQDKGAYGRIVHLQPLQWGADGWPLIGVDPDGDGVGQPVAGERFPDSARNDNNQLTGSARNDADRYKPYGIGLEWQYPAIPSPYWHYGLPDGGIRLYSVQQGEGYKRLPDCPNLLSQKFPAERFTVRACLTFRPNPQLRGEEAGFAVIGTDYAALRLTDTPDGARLDAVTCQNAAETVQELTVLPYRVVPLPHGYESGNVPRVNYPDRPEALLWVELDVRPEAVEGNVPNAECRLRYSLDGKNFTQAGEPFVAKPGSWVGARFGFWCNRFAPKNDAGCLDVTHIRVKPLYDPMEGFLYEEEKVPAYVLPDVLAGTKTAREWERKRRGELLALCEREMYGTAPERPADLHFRVLSEGDAFDGLARRKEVGVYFDADETQFLRLLLYTPAASRKPVPAFLGINFMGNHATTLDPAVALPDTLRYRTDFIVQPRGTNGRRWPMETILRRGYAVATFCCEDVAGDTDEVLGVRKYYEGYSWGNIAAWAWGLSRALDYLETDPEVDASRVTVIGHSRLGKAAIWAAARDPRFAMLVSNASGCGGAALSRRRFGETVRRINAAFPYWFCPNFHRYGDNEDALPFDQHEVLALVAPRPLYVGSGSEDNWADPKGEFLGLAGTTPVYELYGYEGFAPDEWPEVSHPVSKGRCGYHLREGRHDIVLYDWEQYLDFADRMLCE